MVRYDPIISPKVPGGDPAQLHGHFLDQPLMSMHLELHSVPGVAGQLFIRSNTRQHDLQTNVTSSLGLRHICTFIPQPNFDYSFECTSNVLEG